MKALIVKATRTVNRKDTTVWLCFERGGGYGWSTFKKDAFIFAELQAAKYAVGKAQGPWYNEPDLATVVYVYGEYIEPQPAKFIES